MADSSSTPPEKSAVAREIARLKAATERAAATRERLPQPLFWSLFGAQIAELRAAKSKARTVAALLGKIHEEP